LQRALEGLLMLQLELRAQPKPEDENAEI